MKLVSPKYIVRLFLCLCFCGIGDLLHAATGFDTLAITSKDVYPIKDHLYWMQTQKTLTADSAYQMLEKGFAKKLAPNIGINSGFTQLNYWLTFTLKNASNAERHLFYKFNYPFLNNIEVYKRSSSGFKRIIKTGADLPFDTREYPYNDFVFPIRLNTAEVASYLIMVERKGERFSTNPELISNKLFKEQEQRLYITIGIILGIMFFNITINIFFGISLGDKIHYLYAAYLFAALLWVLSSVGADYQLVFPRHPSLFNMSQFFTGALTMALMAQLAIVFLELKKNIVSAYYFLNTFKWVLIFTLAIRAAQYLLFSKIGWMTKITSNLFLVAIAGIAVSIVWATIIRIRQGFKPAWFYLAAMCFLAISIFLTCYIILTTNNLSELVSPPTTIQIGLIIESLIIFAGIIYRYSIFKRERKELALKLADQKLEMTQNILDAQEEERKRLAQDLHDDLGATLSTLFLHITNQPDMSVANPHYERSVAITQKAIADLRNISHDLLPKDFSKAWLFLALKNRVDELNASTPVRFWLNADSDDKLLTETQSITLYRITNELINNTIKHAKASQANIDLAIADGNITLIFDDNGIGFVNPNNEKGIGLRNVYSRVAFLNGKINIDHNAQGTTIIIVLPL